MLRLLTPAFVGSLLLATLSTIADYVWFLNIPQHQVSSGAIHGATLFAALGAYLGWRKGKVGAGALGGLLSGTGRGAVVLRARADRRLQRDARVVAAAVDHARRAADAISTAASIWPRRSAAASSRRSSRRSASPSSCSSSIAAGRRRRSRSSSTSSPGRWRICPASMSCSSAEPVSTRAAAEARAAPRAGADAGSHRRRVLDAGPQVRRRRCLLDRILPRPLHVHAGEENSRRDHAQHDRTARSSRR